MSKKQEENNVPDMNTADVVDENEVNEAVAETSEQQNDEIAQATEGENPLQAEMDTLKDKYLRMAAEYDNFRKRSVREREHSHADAVSRTVAAILPVFDNLERALKQPTEDIEYKKGVELTHRQFCDTLKTLQVEFIEDEPGTVFDPNLHNAVMHVEDENLGDGVIAEVFQHGFKLHEQVIRHSVVKVAN